MKLIFFFYLFARTTTAWADLNFCNQVTVQHNHPQGIHIHKGLHDAELVHSSKYSFTIKAKKVYEPIVVELDSGGYIDIITLFHNCNLADDKTVIELN